MKAYILLFLLVASNVSILNADEPIKLKVEALCSDNRKLLYGDFFRNDSREEVFSLKISSNNLHLTQEAVQSNIDGYVDVPDESYFIKKNDDLYRLDGVVEKLYKDDINQLISYIYNNTDMFISIKEFLTLVGSDNLKLIQESNLKKSGISTSVLDVYFDRNSFNQELKRCEEQINKSRNSLYLNSVLLLFFILITFYLLKKYFKKNKLF